MTTLALVLIALAVLAVASLAVVAVDSLIADFERAPTPISVVAARIAGASIAAFCGVAVTLAIATLAGAR